jgi:acyl carrier protein
MRVNLDDIQSYVKEFYSKVAVVGQDNNIMIAYEAGDAVPKDFEKELIIKLSQKYDLPQSLFSMRVYETLPLLTSGKIDFQKIMSDMNSFELPNVSLWKGFKNWVIKTLEFNDSVTYSSVLEMYCDCLKNNNIKSSQSFDNLEIDSLSFVAISLGIEQLLGIHLPNNWKSLSIEQLETIRLKYISE